MGLLLLLTGATCSGKSTAMKLVAGRRADVDFHDFEEIGMPSHVDQAWRLRSNEQWAQRVARSVGATLLTGQTQLGELLATPSAKGRPQVAGGTFDTSDGVQPRRPTG